MLFKPPQPAAKARAPNAKEKKAFAEMLEDLIGTRGAYILDKELSILGKVPVSELESTIKALGEGIHAVVFDGEVEQPLVATAEKSNIRFLIAMGAKAKATGGCAVLTAENLE